MTSPLQTTTGSNDASTDGAAVADTGTTTVALRAEDGVVVAADRRVSAGGRYVLSKDARKVEAVHPRAVLAMAGVVGGLQEFVDRLRAEVALYEARRDAPMSMDALASAASARLREGPYVSSPTIAGVGEEPRVFDLDAAGGVLEGDYVANGSGMQFALGVLEREYEHGGVDHARRLAARAVGSAIERDTASGNGALLATVTAEGVEFEAHDDPAEVA